MAKTIQDLRKEAGYSSAKDFAAALGIPQSTYARYENQPDGIPLKQAWAIADFLGCSIDMVVGREPVSVEDMRGDIQKLYDSFSSRVQARVDEFLQYASFLEEKEQQRRQKREEASRLQRVQTLERMFVAELSQDQSASAAMYFWTPQEFRERFREFIAARAEGMVEDERAKTFDDLNIRLREEAGLFDSDGEVIVEYDDPEKEAKVRGIVEEATEEVMDRRRKAMEDVVTAVMTDYDRLHPVEEEADPEGRIIYSYVDLL